MLQGCILLIISTERSVLLCLLLPSWRQNHVKNTTKFRSHLHITPSAVLLIL